MKKVQRSGLHEQVIAEIGQRIVGGEFPPDKALPSEAELCSTLGVSRTALREALRVLAAKGLVEPKRKLGTLVCRDNSWNFLDGDVLTWRLQGRNPDRVITELYELRHLIEPIAASLAAKHASAADLRIMREAYRRMQAAGNDGEKFAPPDLEFHQAIIAASGNRLFSSLAHVVRSALAVNFKFVRNPPRGHVHSLPMHKKVLDAIEANNSSGARVAMQKLIEDSQREAKSVRSAANRRRGAATRKASGVVDRA